MSVKPALVVAGLAVATVGTVQYPVSDNVRYVLGLLRVSGFSPADTFAHRPIVYRLAMAVHSWLPGMVGRGIDQPGSLVRLRAFETGLNVVSVMIAAAAAVLLWAGLRRRWSEVAWAYGAGAYAALAFLAPMLGEPDWYAAVFAVAAVGVGLLGRPLLGGSLAGVLLALAALVKFVTLPVALAALLVLWALDPRRAWIATAAAFVSGCLAMVAIWSWAPWEIGWMLDIRALQPSFWAGRHTVLAARNTVVQLAVLWPSFVLLPAFFVGAKRREALVAVALIVLVTVPIVFQGEYWLYHTISLAVLSCLLAVRTLLRSRGALFWPALVYGAWTAVLFLPPMGLRLDAGLNRGAWLSAYAKPVVVVAVASSVLLAALQWRALRRPSARPAASVQFRAALAIAVTLLASQTPPALSASIESRSANHQLADQVHEVVGAAPVVYLTPGWVTYYLRNPTRCRYPSPLFLQRPLAAKVADPAHRDENLACLSYDQARWLVWRQDWLNPVKAASDVLATIDHYWDCAQAVRVDRLTLCPRRLS